MGYSQIGQDDWVLQNCPKPGFFIEIGADDGISLSNTKALEDQGWTGICVECSDNFVKLQRNRKCITVNACVWSTTGIIVDFGQTPVKSLSGITSCYADQHDRTRAVVTKRTTTSLNDILIANAAPAHIDYLSIDTEGSELEILSALDFNRFTFTCMTIEHNNVKAKLEGVRALLMSHGYKLYQRVKFDDWFIRE